MSVKKIRILLAISSSATLLQVTGCAIIAPDTGSYQVLSFLRTLFVNIVSWGLGAAFS